jgi:acetyl-CoA/propionyl-CoA carboxylase biotin carboxyl carrier protein
VLRAAVDSGADAVHPGYGFLAEDAEFAQSVLDAGLTWIGPPPSVIRRLADKLSARQVAGEAGAPLLPALADPARDAAQVEAFARANGLPIVIKAVAGGGGSCVSVARATAEIQPRYAEVMRAAAAADGQAQCFAERFLDRARHVETQCLADRYGHVVVVSTRDCSLQRRHQKIVEEAPAPFLPRGLDARLRVISREILRAVGYVGAATCEFLLGRDGALAFLETNARLAVAHPVSEEVTGLGSVVAPAFGTLLAKLVVAGASRPEALLRARLALSEFEISGVATNLPFHRWLIRNEAFARPAAGAPWCAHAGWVDETWPAAGTPARSQ